VKTSLAIDPGTGHYVLDASRQRLAYASATVQRVIRRLRTPRGQCLLDPTYGVDMSFTDKAYPDLAARWRAAVLDALKPEIDASAIADVSVTVDHANGHLLYNVRFLDVLARERRTLDLSVRA
jgi:hypothetical protein